MKLSDIFDEVSKQMLSDFRKAKKSLSHSGLKGDSNEETVRKFLRQYIPRSLDVTTGMIVDSTGSQSRQLDVIICDSHKTPILFQSGEVRVIPVECVYAVIEVKAKLNKAELEKSYQNMESVKSLTKTAYFKQSGAIKDSNNLYGKKWSHWPLHHFIFAFESIKLPTLLGYLNSLQSTNEVHFRIDTICVLNRGIICNQHSDGFFSALPEPKSTTVFSETSNSLLLFYSLLSVIMNQAKMKPFNLISYMKDMKF